MLDINCSKCGHLKIFHHEVYMNVCNKQSLTGCHSTIQSKEDTWLECDCEEIYEKVRDNGKI